jgi:putative heme iron utilization protein
MNPENPRVEGARIISAQRWLALATVDERAIPSVSYVPFAPVGGALGIVVSRLAAHTANLLARRAAAVLLVDDERVPPDAYARSRFSIEVSARPHPPGSAEAHAVWTALAARQSATVETLRMLPDFAAVSLEPLAGRLVLGFASAHDVDAAVIKEILFEVA